MHYKRKLSRSKPENNFKNNQQCCMYSQPCLFLNQITFNRFFLNKILFLVDKSYRDNNNVPNKHINNLISEIPSSMSTRATISTPMALVTTKCRSRELESITRRRRHLVPKVLNSKATLVYNYEKYMLQGKV